MASLLSFFSRQQSISRRKSHSRRLQLEHLENRLNLAADLLVTTTIASTEQVLREFTPDGELVRTAVLPVVSGVQEPGRDLIYDASGKVHVFGGTFDAALCSYTLDGGGWTQHTHPGWSSVNLTSYGGIGQLGDYVFVTDMTTFNSSAAMAKGVVRFNLADGTSARFLETEEPHDLAIGKDGRLYLLNANTIKGYDPTTFAQLSSVSLPAGDYRGMAVNTAGDIFAVNQSEQVYHLSATGEVLGMVTLTGVSDPMDIDVSGDGRVAIGTESGHVVQMSEDLTGITSFLAGTYRAFVAFGPDEAESPAGPTPPTAAISSDIVVTEGDSGDSYAVFTVTLSAPSVDPVAFKYLTVAGTASAGSDFWQDGSTRVILPGQTSTQIYLHIVGDTTFEADESFSLTLSEAVGVTLDDSSAVVTIANDDPSTPYFLVGDITLNEGSQSPGTVYSFVVKLSTPSTQTVTVNYATRNNTAIAGSDYEARSGTLTFSPGQLERTVDVIAFTDLAVEPDETFFFELSNAAGADITDPQAVGTIVNDDSVYQVAVNNAYGFEGNGEAASVDFTVTLNQASTETITVEYFTFDSDATAYIDYERTLGILVFDPGETSKTVSVPILGDTEIESDEDFYFVLAYPVGATLANDYAMGFIGNDDSYPGNTAPIAADNSYELAEDYSFSVWGLGILANDYDLEGDLLQAFLVSGPAHGYLSLDPSGGFYYYPDANYFGPDSFVYRATDAGGLSDLATVSLMVWGMDDPIDLTTPAPQTTAEESPITFSSANGNAITVADIESPRVLVALLGYYGTATVQNTADVEFPYPENNGTNSLVFYADSPAEANAALEGLVFSPDVNFNGTAHLSVLVQDLSVMSSYPIQDYADIPISVTPVNDGPVAADDAYEWAEDQSLVVSDAAGILRNDYDLDWPVLAGGGGDPPLTAVLVSGPAHGSVTLNSGGGFTYTPEANYFGTDSFTYRAADESLQSNVATVTLRIWSMDDPIEVAVPTSQTIAEDTSITFSAPNGTAFAVSDVESPRVLVNLMAQDGILTLASTAGLEFPYPESTNNSSQITFYADNPAEANAALEGLVFSPNANFNGQVYVTILAHDMTAIYYPMDAFAYVQVTVTPVNDAPVAVNDSYAAEAGMPFWATWGGGGSGFSVLMNDHDVDMEILTSLLVSGPSHGTLEFNSDGTFIYTADSTYSGTDSFTYRAFDGQLESGLATATFNVTLNQPPVSVGDAYSVNEDSSLFVSAPGVLGNDTEPNGQPLTAHLFSGPAHGTLTLNANGSFTYAPTANYHGSDQFWYRAFDGTYYSDPVAVALTVNSINDAPVAANNTYSVNEDVVLTVVGSGVLGNDSDIDSATLTAAVVSSPGHGVLNLNADGSFSYTPNANYNGSDSFTYRANDGQASSNVATVNITVNAVNDAPLAANDSYSVNEDQTLTIAPVPGITSLTMVSQPGDYIGQGQTYSYTPATGTFMVNRNFDNGVSVFYSGGGHTWHLDFASPFDAPLTPGMYANATRWPFQASNVPGLSVYGDGRGSNTLTGNFTVTQAVYAADGKVLRFAATFEQHNEGFAPALTGTINYNQGDFTSGILANDSDIEGNPLTVIVVSGPAHGTLSMNVDGSFIYQPTANYNGADNFTYKLSDGTSESNVATVALTVNAVNDFPTANPDSYTVAEDNVLTVGAPGVLANDFDVDGESLTATLITSPTHGSLVFNTNGSFVYTPQANYGGSDSFQYAARDGGGSFSFIRTVSLNVTSVNDAPTASNDSYTTTEDTPLTIAVTGLLANDSDVEGSALSAVLVNDPVHGTLALSGNGSFTYTPNANYYGTDTFTYKASDGSADSNTATVLLTIGAVNDPPTAADDSYSVDEDQSLTIAAAGVLGNDSDVEGMALTAVLFNGPTHGTLTLNADGSFTYLPTANYNGSDSFAYKANDGSLDSNVVTVSLTVNSVNDVPTAGADAYVVDEDQALLLGLSGVLANDADVDGDTLTTVLISGPSHGTLNLNADGSFSYTPNANYHGSDNFTYKANDGNSDSSLATVSLTILAVNDTPTATDDAYLLAEDQSLTVAAPGALANDGDVDGDWLNVVLVSGPVHGTLNLNADHSFTYTPNADYNGGDSFTYKANDGSADSNVATVTLTISAVNDAPVAAAGPDRQNGEGGTATFNTSGSFDVDGDNLTYFWDFGDGQTAYGFSVQHAHADQGTYTVKLTVSDGVTSATDSLVMTVLNGAPLATLSGSDSGVRGQTQTFNFGALDPSPVDQAANFTYFINWGDGNTQSISGPVGSQAGHVYTATGTYTVSLQATDKDGALGAVVQQTITINSVMLQNGNLVVGGTTSGDTINLKVADSNGGVRVTINGTAQGVYNPSGAIFVYAQAGIDNIQFETTKFTGQTRYIQDAAFVFGGDGNDSLDARGSSANNVIVGGTGNDTIWGGTGRDILIGGQGADTLRGGAADDLLIGNGTIYDANVAALAALLTEWGRTDANYGTRANNLLGQSGGLNNGYFLDPNTVLADAVVDQLYGEAGLDLFFSGFTTPADTANDFSGGEMKIGL